MNGLLILLLVLGLYFAALKWIPFGGVSADQDRVDHELIAIRAHAPCG